MGSGTEEERKGINTGAQQNDAEMDSLSKVEK